MRKTVPYRTAKRKPSPKPPKRVKRRSKTKGGRGSDPKKIAWLHTQGCCICGAMPVEVHHDRRLGSRAMDRKTVPLCPLHHMDGSHSVGRMGRTGFEHDHRIDMDELTATYESIWQAHQARGGA